MMGGCISTTTKFGSTKVYICCEIALLIGLSLILDYVPLLLARTCRNIKTWRSYRNSQQLGWLTISACRTRWYTDKIVHCFLLSHCSYESNKENLLCRLNMLDKMSLLKKMWLSSRLIFLVGPWFLTSICPTMS